MPTMTSGSTSPASMPASACSRICQVRPWNERRAPVEEVLPVLHVKHRVTALRIVVVAGRNIDDQVALFGADIGWGSPDAGAGADAARLVLRPALRLLQLRFGSPDSILRGPLSRYFACRLPTSGPHLERILVGISLRQVAVTVSRNQRCSSTKNRGQQERATHEP